MTTINNMGDMLNTKLISIIIHSIFYVVNLSSYLILIKYFENTYSYDNFWFNTLLSTILVPIYIGYFLKKNVRDRVFNYGKALFFPFLAGSLYTIESILLYYSVNNLSLSYYTILRSSFVVWNIPFFILFLKKPISNIYYCGCILLMLSYSAIIYYYLQLTISIWKPTLSIIISCLFNSVYNIIIEYSVKKYNIYNLDYQIIFQITYFVFAFIPSIKMTIECPPPITFNTIIISFFISVCLQVYFYNKIIILQHDNEIVPSNVLISGLDIIRRLVLLSFSFVMFNDELTLYIIVSIICFLGSGICMFLEYLKPLKKNNFEYNEMDKI